MAKKYIFTRRLVGGIAKIMISILELLLRGLYLLMPIGFYMLLMQLRSNMSKATSISSYITDKSEWQFVYSGTMLVMLEPNSLKDRWSKFNSMVINYINRNKPWFILWIVLIITAIGIKILF